MPVNHRLLAQITSTIYRFRIYGLPLPERFPSTNKARLKSINLSSLSIDHFLLQEEFSAVGAENAAASPSKIFLGQIG